MYPHEPPPVLVATYLVRAGGAAVFTRHWAPPVDVERPRRFPVVLVHGLAVSSRYMIPAAEALARLGWDVYAMDLPGTGRSERPRVALGVEALARALGDWMDAAGVPRAALVGHSLGTQVVVELLVREPGRAPAVVLASPTVDPAARTTVWQAWRLARDLPRECRALIWIAGTDYLRAGVFRMLCVLRDAIAVPLETRLPGIAVPALVIRGERDPIVPAGWAAAVAGLLPDGALATVAGAPHAVNYSAVPEFVTLVHDHLERIPQPRSVSD